MRQFYSQVGVVVLLAVCGAALRWGRRPERRAGAVFLLAWVTTLALQRLAGDVAPVVGIVAVDVAVFAFLLASGARDRAGWQVYAVAAQGVALGVHVIRLLSPGMATWTYLTALAASSYGVLLALAWGVWSARRERRLGLSS